MFKVIAANDGGGAKGIMQAYMYKYLEDQLMANVNEVVDLWVGTSVGSITSGLMASGKISADGYFRIMEDNLESCFKKRFRLPFLQAKYSKKPLIKLLRDVLGNMRLGDVHKPLVITAASLVTGRNHFFKSYDEKDANRGLVDVITYSWSAPVFFGSSVDDSSKQVWMDGGTGSMNCPIDEAIVEALNLNWFTQKDSDRIHLLSLGCGHHIPEKIPFHKARKDKNLAQALKFLDPSNGGMARTQLEATKGAMLEALSTKFDSFSYNRVEPILSKKLDAMDELKYKSEYIKIAKEMVHKINLKPLKERLNYEQR